MAMAKPPGGGRRPSSKAKPSADGLPQDPVAFVKRVLREKPYDKQKDILTGVARSRRVSVVGCNGSGKDWAAARAVLWWVHSRSPAKVIVTGPTTRQVDDIVWNEIRAAYNRAPETFPGRMYRTSRYEIDDQSFALGFATSSPYNLQGFSLAQPDGGGHRGSCRTPDGHGRHTTAQPVVPAYDGQPIRGGGRVLRFPPLQTGASTTPYR